MQQLIASYLFQRKYCPLPGMGSLSVEMLPSASDFVNKLLTAPAAVIRFNKEEKDDDGLVHYIAIKKDCTASEARTKLKDFCTHLKWQLDQQPKVTIEGVGSFSIDAARKIQFRQQELPQELVPPVKAERIIHPEAAHHMVVGDKETTTTVMTDYFSEAPETKDRWWIWAIVLFAVSVTAIIIYFNDPGHSSLFGNAVSYKSA